MRYEFRWDLPGEGRPSELVLRIHSITGWLGSKQLLLNHQTIFRRGIFGGINHRFGGIPGRPRLHLRADRSPADGKWRPMLFADDRPVPEKLNTAPPPNPQRPMPLAVTVGLTYLLIFILFIMWLPIENMLYAAKAPADSRVFILAVEKTNESALIHGDQSDLPDTTVGLYYEAKLSPLDRRPPVTWRRKTGRIPPGLALDETSGVVSGSPTEPGDYPLVIRVIDAKDQSTEFPFVIRVKSGARKSPRIVTERLPVAIVGQPYAATLRAEGGKPPYEWVCNSRKLPNGLKLESIEEEVPDDDASGEPKKRTTWQIAGTPVPAKSLRPDDEPEPVAGAYPIRLRVNDAGYSARADTLPWFIPIIATVVCLLGFWSMIRASVFVFGAVILAEVAAWFGNFDYAPISMAAVVLQAMILLVGIAYMREMR